MGGAKSKRTKKFAKRGGIATQIQSRRKRQQHVARVATQRAKVAERKDRAVRAAHDGKHKHTTTTTTHCTVAPLLLSFEPTKCTHCCSGSLATTTQQPRPSQLKMRQQPLRLGKTVTSRLRP